MPRAPKPSEYLEATLYKVGEPPANISLERTGTFDPLYKLLGCDTIEIVDLGHKQVMILDENGKIFNKPMNAAATLVARGHIMDDDHIVGDVLVASRKILSKGR